MELEWGHLCAPACLELAVEKVEKAPAIVLLNLCVVSTTEATSILGLVVANDTIFSVPVMHILLLLWSGPLYRYLFELKNNLDNTFTRGTI